MEVINLKISNPEKQIQKPIKAESGFSDQKKRKLAKAATDFESLLTQMMLKSMTKSTGGLFGEKGYGSDVYNTLFESEIAKYMTKSKSMGIASMVYKKITGEELDMNKLEFGNLGSGSINELLLRAKSESDGNSGEIKPNTASLKRLKKLEPIIEKIAGKYGVSSSVVKSIILAESAGKHDAVSRANAKGLMQLMDDTAKELGVENVFDPEENIEGGTKYFSQLFNKYDGNIELALAAYNAGPDSVKKYGGVPPYKETQNYVSRIKNYLNYFEMSHE
jgi:soluble lytic murein transglycosylase-like protein